MTWFDTSLAKAQEKPKQLHLKVHTWPYDMQSKKWWL